MQLLVQRVLVWLYLALPLAVLVAAILRARPARRGRIVARAAGVGVLAVVIASLALGLTAWVLDGHVPPAEFARSVYLTASALLLLGGLGALLRWSLFRLLRVPVDGVGYPLPAARHRATIALLMQRVLLLALAIPYLAAMFAVYRPRLVFTGNPRSELNAAFQRVPFAASDGVRLEGWWIPVSAAPPRHDALAAAQWGRRTVVLCHALASTRHQQFAWARQFLANGFNVFLFDFRAHGDSDGRLTSFGDLERRDVLAAVRWVKDAYPGASEKLFAVGANMGAVAALAAAADETDGAAIDGLVLYEPYPRLDEVCRSSAAGVFPRPIAWLVYHVGLPVATAHAGANLCGFRPVDFVTRIAPRPILVVHGRGESFVPVLQQMDVYQQAWLPKDEFWPVDNRAAQARPAAIPVGAWPSFIHFLGELRETLRDVAGVNDVITTDPGAMHRVIRFLRNAESRSVL